MEDIRTGTEFAAQRFENLDHPGMELNGTKFHDCEFQRCNFSEAQLQDCVFDNCRFVDCNLSNAIIRRSSLREVAFERCKLVGIDWTTARWPSIALSGLLAFDECRLDGSSFFGLYLQELKLEACHARDVDFSEADCEHASFIQTDFTDATFHHTKLRKADFTDACAYTIDVRTNSIEGARFSMPEAVGLLQGLGIELIE